MIQKASPLVGALVCACALLACSRPAADVLSPAERAWLEDHRAVRLRATPDYFPSEFRAQDGTYSGISADVMALIGERLDIEFEVTWFDDYEGRPWGDVVPLSTKTPLRARHRLYTEPYLEYPSMIIARTGALGPSSMADLAGKRVAVVSGYAIEEHLGAHYEEIEVVPVADNRAGMLAASFGEVDAFLSELPVATHLLEQEGITNLRVTGESGFTYSMGIAVSNELPVLHSILEKGLALVTPAERQAIIRRWQHFERDRSNLHPWITVVALLAGLASVAFFGFRTLRHRHTYRRAVSEWIALKDQSQRSEALARLVGSVVHDFNNMLTVISGYAETMLDKVRKKECLHADLAEVLAATDRASELSKQLLMFSKPATHEPRVVDVNSTIRGARRLIERAVGDGVNVSLRLDRSLGRVVLDTLQVEQLLINLSLNARDAMPGGGSLVIETRRENEGGVEQVVLEVSDTGPGIPREDREKIFEPFYTTKASGTGLGLYNVAEIARRANGEVEVSGGSGGAAGAEGEGGGALFRFRFPAVCESHGVCAMPAVSETLEYAGIEAHLAPVGGTILIVDDDASVRGLLSKTLRAAGHAVEEAVDGEAALRWVDLAPRTFDVVIVDLALPGASGIELASRLRARHGNVQFLFLSGLESAGALLANGPFSDDALLPKPVRLEDVFETVGRLVEPLSVGVRA